MSDLEQKLTHLCICQCCSTRIANIAIIKDHLKHVGTLYKALRKAMSWYCVAAGCSTLTREGYNSLHEFPQDNSMRAK